PGRHAPWRRSPLFESGARTVEACQKDFMPVGNGDAFDQATAKPYRVLAKLYPQDKAHFGNGGSNNSSLRSAGLRLREAVNQIGYKTVDYQEQPPLVPNWRPYVEEAKLKGVKAFQQI